LRYRDRATLPILMYHYVDQLPPGLTDIFRKDLTVSPVNFRKQLQYLADNSVQTVGLSRLSAHFRGGDPLPQRAVVLTFDDGYEDNYRVAFPILKELGMTGTFFVVTDFIGRPGYMSWEQLREMELHGMSIESHSVDHADLTSVSKAELERQLKQSRRLLEQQLVRPVRYLCYPSGKYNPAVMTAAQAAGYEGATSINHGLMQLRSEEFELKRVRVRGTDTIDQLAARMVPPDWKYFRGAFGR
jgi:peptidoglycan/xylan/chitin deacetylase (PgdA/CDA1 family)